MCIQGEPTEGCDKGMIHSTYYSGLKLYTQKHTHRHTHEPPKTKRGNIFRINRELSVCRSNFMVNRTENSKLCCFLPQTFWHILVPYCTSRQQLLCYAYLPIYLLYGILHYAAGFTAKSTVSEGEFKAWWHQRNKTHLKTPPEWRLES